MPTTEIEMWKSLFGYVNGGSSDGEELDWRYCGLDVWPIVKSQILMRGSNIYNAGRQMSLTKGAKQAPQSRPTFISRWRRASRAVVPDRPAPTPKVMPNFDWPQLPRPEVAADVICMGYATNHKKLGNSHFQLCMDPLRLALARADAGSVCLITGLDDVADGIEHSAAKGVYGIERQFRAVRNLAKQMPPVELKDFPGFAAWWDGLGKLLGNDMFVTVEHIETVIQQTAVVGAWLKDYFASTRPRIVLVSAYYGLIGHGGSWACRELGIPIADVQHGVAGSNHHAYSWPNAPVSGFNTLPSGFLTWSEQECAEMRKTSGAWSPDLLAIGNVWRLLDETLGSKDAADLFRPKALATARDEVSKEHKAIAAVKEKSPGEKDILLALHPDEPLPWFNRFKQLAPSEWRFWIRLHPGEFKNNEALAKRLEAVCDERTFVIEPSKAPLNVILSEVDAVLTKFSSVALDARAYGVPTVAYSDAARIFFDSPEVHRISFVPPFPERMRAALVQRLSDYRPAMKEIQPIEQFDVLGHKLIAALAGKPDRFAVGDLSSGLHRAGTEAAAVPARP